MQAVLHTSLLAVLLCAAPLNCASEEEPDPLAEIQELLVQLQALDADARADALVDEIQVLVQSQQALEAQADQEATGNAAERWPTGSLRLHFTLEQDADHRELAVSSAGGAFQVAGHRRTDDGEEHIDIAGELSARDDGSILVRYRIDVARGERDGWHWVGSAAVTPGAEYHLGGVGDSALLLSAEPLTALAEAADEAHDEEPAAAE